MWLKFSICVVNTLLKAQVYFQGSSVNHCSGQIVNNLVHCIEIKKVFKNVMLSIDLR